MSDKTTKVILTNMPNGTKKATILRLGNWTEQQKQNFITTINKYIPSLYYFDCACSFNIHYDQSIIHVCPFDKPKTFIPLHPRDKKNEMIIEIIPNTETAKCYSKPKPSNIHCLDSISCKNCRSKFIKDNLLIKIWYNHKHI